MKIKVNVNSSPNITEVIHKDGNIEIFAYAKSINRTRRLRFQLRLLEYNKNFEKRILFIRNNLKIPEIGIKCSPEEAIDYLHNLSQDDFWYLWEESEKLSQIFFFDGSQADNLMEFIICNTYPLQAVGGVGAYTKQSILSTIKDDSEDTVYIKIKSKTSKTDIFEELDDLWKSYLKDAIEKLPKIPHEKNYKDLEINFKIFDWRAKDITYNEIRDKLNDLGIFLEVETIKKRQSEFMKFLQEYIKSVDPTF